MNSISLYSIPDGERILSIGSLNVLSLRKHLADVKGDFKLQECDVICMQETWLYEGEESSQKIKLNIPYKTLTVILLAILAEAKALQHFSKKLLRSAE